MKKLLLLFALTTTAGAQIIRNWAPNFEFNFGGLNTHQDSSKIEDSDAQDAANVLTDNGFLEKRPGNKAYVTVSSGTPIKYLYEYITTTNTRFLIAQISTTVYSMNSGQSAQFLNTITAGQDLDCVTALGKLTCADGSDPAFTFDGTSTGTIANIPAACTYFAWAYNRLFCGAPSADLSQVAVSSYSDITTWATSSQFPIPPNSPSSFEFNKNDGDSITCLKLTPFGIYVGKKYSSWVIKGYDFITFYTQNIDPAIGCTDQRSVQVVNGLVTWMSQKGIYQWDGTGLPQWISSDIDPTFRKITQPNSANNFWSLNSNADFQLGFSTANGPTLSWDVVDGLAAIWPSSTSITDGSTTSFAAGSFNNISTGVVYITLSSTTFHDAIQSTPVNGALAGWTTLGAGSWAIEGNPIAGVAGNVLATQSVAATHQITTAVSQSSGVWAFNIGQTAGSRTAYVKFMDISTSAATTSFANDSGYALEVSVNAGATSRSIFLVKYPSVTTLCSSNTTPSGSLALAQTYQINRDQYGNFDVYDTVNSTSAPACSVNDTSYSSSTQLVLSAFDTSQFFWNFNFYQYASTGLYTSKIFDTKFSTALPGTFTISSSPALAGMSLKFNIHSASSTSGAWSGYVALSTNASIAQTGRYWQYNSSFTTTLATASPQINASYLLAASTGIYYSPVDNVGSLITTWGNFAITDTQQTSGELSYSVRQATYNFNPVDTSISWSAQTKNTNVVLAVSTPTWFQYKIDSSNMLNATMTAIVNRSVVNWKETSNPRAASGFIDQRYFLAVTTTTSGQSNDMMLIYQRNKKWIPWTGPSVAALTQYNQRLLGGSGNTDSKAWYIMQDNVYDDDGVPINSYWVSKDFILGSPFNNKVLYEIWTDNFVVSGGSVTVGYAVDKSTTFTSKTFPVDGVTNVQGGMTSTQSSQKTFLNAGTAIGKYLRFKFSDNSLSKYMRLHSYLFYTDIQSHTAQ